MFFDPVYWLVIAAGMALSLWASVKTRSTFAHFSQLRTQRGLTGAQVATAILQEQGISDVTIEPVRGSLSDHYDPRSKTLRLSEPVYARDSMAAAGVAAHEVGHAIQHAQGYAPLQFRSAWVPVASLSGNLSMFVIIAAFLLGGAQTAMGQTVGLVGVVMFGATTVFTLVTLPVEFDASRRAMASLQRSGFLTPQEQKGAKKVLDAAALTYVAAFLGSLLTLLYWAFRLGLLGGRRRG